MQGDRIVRAFGYVRVSTDTQAVHGVSLEGQQTAVSRECASRGWELVDVVSEARSAKDMRRPLLQELLERLDRGEGGALVVARMDRLSRSVLDFAGLMDRAHKHGWSIVCLDPAVDMTTPFGRAMAQMSAVFAELERALVSQRAKEAVQAMKLAGTYRTNEPQVSDVAVEAILEMRAAGMSTRKIAAQLDVEGVPTVQGGPWAHQTVRVVINRAGREAA